MSRIFISIACAAALAGCAGEQAMRNVSGRTAGVLNQYRNGLAQFADEQTQQNAANQSRLVHLQALRDELLSEVHGRQSSWRLAGRKQALEEFSLLTQINAATILEAGALSPKPVAEAASVSFDPAAVNAVIKQLLALQKPPSGRERALDFLKFTSEVRASMQQSLEKAAAETEEAAEQGQAATQVVGEQPKI